MNHPHDYYPYPGGDPNLHSRGNNRPYVEPDYAAMGHQRQLPLISTMGRGPRGEGIFVHVIQNDDGNFSFALVSDKTNETIMQSPNLSGGSISVSQEEHVMVPGEVGHFTITVKRGREVKSYVIDIPPGADGSRIYLVGGSVERKTDDVVYTFNESELFYDGNNKYPSKPRPRANDTVIFTTHNAEGTENYLTVGHVQMSSSPLVVVTAQVFLPALQGPQGDEGKQGLKGDKGEPGRSVVMQSGIYREPGSDKPLPDLPPFETTEINHAFTVDDDETEGQLDLYIRGEGGTDWTIIENWGGIPGPMGPDASIHAKTYGSSYEEIKRIQWGDDEETPPPVETPYDGMLLLLYFLEGHQAETLELTYSDTVGDIPVYLHDNRSIPSGAIPQYSNMALMYDEGLSGFRLMEAPLSVPVAQPDVYGVVKYDEQSIQKKDTGDEYTDGQLYAPYSGVMPVVDTYLNGADRTYANASLPGYLFISEFMYYTGSPFIILFTSGTPTGTPNLRLAISTDEGTEGPYPVVKKDGSNVLISELGMDTMLMIKSWRYDNVDCFVVLSGLSEGGGGGGYQEVSLFENYTSPIVLRRNDETTTSVPGMADCKALIVAYGLRTSLETNLRVPQKTARIDRSIANTTAATNHYLDYVSILSTASWAYDRFLCISLSVKFDQETISFAPYLPHDGVMTVEGESGSSVGGTLSLGGLATIEIYKIIGIKF